MHRHVKPVKNNTRCYTGSTRWHMSSLNNKTPIMEALLLFSKIKFVAVTAVYTTT